MASSSSSSPQIKYDVFLSFRGEDTRYNFTSHLHAALQRKQIDTFIDYELKKGDYISPSLLSAIEGSQISVVVFSEGYASSSWCLDELVKIMECKNKYGQIVIPVFYNVDPSHVRKQTGAFGDGFMKLEQRFQENSERWRCDLREAANISGSHIHGIRPESELIEDIVDDIWKSLNDIFESDDNNYLVGVGPRIKEIESLLSIGSTNVFILGIWGMGGIGKTTIAKAIFDKISNKFEGSYFVGNVREAEEKNGLPQLQRELFSALLGDSNLMTGIFNLKSLIRRLNRRKVLIVFDDVTHRQIEFLIGRLDWCAPAPESRVIITTRDEQVIKISSVDERYKIYEMKELEEDDALKLFSRRAFKKNYPDADYMELSREVIRYAHGVPLALEILGGFLFEMEKEDWESEINKLKKGPHVDIQKVLKVSYDNLDREEQNIFLDIACFLKGKYKNVVIRFLDACHFSAKVGIRVLLRRCIIKISRKNTIVMHDLLQEMGKEIVREESINNPGERSRLWHYKDICEVLAENTGTKAIECISLNMNEVQKFKMNEVREFQLHLDAFTKMPNLRYLRLIGIDKWRLIGIDQCNVFCRYLRLIGIHKWRLIGINQSNVFCFEGRGFRKVRYFEWHGYPLKSLPLGINLENLVSLIMPWSSVEQLWDGDQNLVQLKDIDLGYSEQLKKLPNLSRATKLETFILTGCSSLIEFPEISSCNIRYLFLGYCKKLESLPSSVWNSKSLKKLYLDGCSNLRILPEELGNLESLKTLSTTEVAVTQSLSSIICLNNLTTIKLMNCGITELPESLGQLSSLKELRLDTNNFERIPASIVHLSRLETLIVSYCERLQCLPELPRNIKGIFASTCTSLESLSPCGAYDYCLKNCLKLERVELSQIINDAVYGNAWSEGHIRPGKICYPGSEIPEWFSFRSMGSSITLPRSLCGKKIVGMALCAVASFQGYFNNTTSVIEFHCRKCGFLGSEGILDCGIRSDHVFFGLYRGLNYCCDEEMFSQFYITNGEDYKWIEWDDIKQMENNAVTKCGFHIFYAQDYNIDEAEESNQTTEV